MYAINWIYFISENELCVPSSEEQTLALQHPATLCTCARETHEKRIPKLISHRNKWKRWLRCWLLLASFDYVYSVALISISWFVFAAYESDIWYRWCGVQFQRVHFSILHLKTATISESNRWSLQCVCMRNVAIASNTPMSKIFPEIMSIQATNAGWILGISISFYIKKASSCFRNYEM